MGLKKSELRIIDGNKERATTPLEPLKSDILDRKPIECDILATKLVPSFIPGALLRRNRLLSKLGSNPGARLRLIYGAAGAGKSSLLYDYARQQVSPVAWYTLQESDRDPKVFLTYFLSSLGLHSPAIVSKPLLRLSRVANLDLEWKAVIITLINELCVYQNEILMIMDDYHLLDGEEIPSEGASIHQIMDFLLRNAPPNFRLIIASRALPALPLPFLQSKNALIMIRPEELLLDTKEVNILFNEVWEQKISEESIRLISSKTEGWFAAVRLIAQAISDKTKAEAEAYLRNLDRTENFVYDYLASEIYYRQPEELRMFLKFTSILNSFSADLAAFVTGFSKVSKILHKIEDMNLFVIHLDTKKEWFRYHALFADFLQNLLRNEEGGSRLRELHRRAGLWFEGKGDVTGAIEHYLNASEWKSAGRLLIEHSQALFQRGIIQRLSKWIASLPRNMREKSSALLLLHGELHDARGNWEKAVNCYEDAIERLRKEKHDEKIPAILEKLILCLIKYGEYSKIFGYCREALKSCDPNNIGLRSRIMSWLGVAHVIYGDGDWDNAYRMLKEGYLLAYKSGEPEAIVAAGIGYGFIYHFPRGNFQAAELVFNEGAELLKRAGVPYLACHLMMNKAVVQIFGGYLERARETIAAAFKMADEYELHFVKQALYLNEAKLHIEERNTREARRALSIVIEQEIPLQIKPWYYRTMALLHLLEGNVGQAAVAGAQMIDHLGLVGKGIYAPECYIVMGIICWKKNLHYKAQKWFRDALAIANSANMKLWITKAHYCLAGTYALIGREPDDFKEHYRAALIFSGDNNYWHIWKTDLYDLTIPIILFAFKYRVEKRETKRIMDLVKPRLLDLLKSQIDDGKVEEKLMASRILGFIGDHDSRLLLKKVDSDTHSKVRRKAEKLLSQSSPPIPTLSIITLGQFSVSRNDIPLSENEWRRKKSLKLFKYFLSHYPGEVITDHIIETFWPDLPLNRARQNFAVFLAYARKALNPFPHARRDESFLVCGKDLCFLKLGERDYLDFIDFQNLCSEGIDQWNNGLAEIAVEKFLKALKVYRGDFLEGNLYDDWADYRRKELLELYLMLLECLALHHCEEGEFQEAFTYYSLYLDKNPFQENIMEKALKCLAALGDRVSMKREYARFTKLIKKKVGSPLSPAIVELMTKTVPGS